ncbi:MAG: hypothetical protein ACI9FO_000741 [Methylophagaceae bacterium]|jgi:hypothetical protein
MTACGTYQTARLKTPWLCGRAGSILALVPSYIEASVVYSAGVFYWVSFGGKVEKVKLILTFCIHCHAFSLESKGLLSTSSVKA